MPLGQEVASISSMKNTTPQLYFILHNIRSAHNVGAIFRTADGIGVAKVFLTGYTCAPYDGRDPWTTKPERMIGKVALGADQTMPWEKVENVTEVIAQLKSDGVQIVALEQTEMSVDVADFVADGRSVALVLGNESKGVDAETLALCDAFVEISMRGMKESLNVSVATGVAGYALYDKINTEG